MMRLPKYILVFLCCSLWACGSTTGATGGTETGNPDKISLRVLGYQSSLLQALQLPGLTVSGASITTAQIVLGTLQFRPLSVCVDNQEDNDDLTFTGPFIVDLLQSQAINALEEIQVPADDYCRVELKLKKLESNVSNSSSIVRRSVLIEGTRSDDIPFQISLAVDEEFKLENAVTGFQVDNNTSIPQFFIAFDLDQWLSGVDLDSPSLVVDVDGNGDPFLFIDDDFNSSVREQIIENLKFSADLFKDNDDDDELDADEQSNSLAEGESLP